MNKSDLRTGMLVTLRNNNTYYVMLDTGLTRYYLNDVLVHRVGHETGWLSLMNYNDDLTYYDDPGDPDEDRMWDIVQVDACSNAAYLFLPQGNYRTIWKREEE